MICLFSKKKRKKEEEEEEEGINAKFRDHFQRTAKYRGAARTICNPIVKQSCASFIPKDLLKMND